MDEICDVASGAYAAMSLPYQALSFSLVSGAVPRSASRPCRLEHLNLKGTLDLGLRCTLFAARRFELEQASTCFGLKARSGLVQAPVQVPPGAAKSHEDFLSFP